ncbi:acyltransferase [Dermacoccus nishinomiyaensis]|uniref:acyltransferase n=1 Tax=Dermacoccus nishinomiyaensis TaxID=1274 RepID=UPI0021A2CC6E|nr:acyltransferase [Dermacoccus nishinomiyaensis]MCT1603380.1 acyltransferase [Dermacoccus nishinomiyaensis]
MTVARLIVEKSAGLRYRRAQLRMPLLRRAFREIGQGSVIVAPLYLQGVERIRVGSGVMVRDGAWLATENDTSSLTVGDDTYIGHRAHLHSIDPVTIGRGCVLADNVMVSTSDHDRRDRHRVHGTGPIHIGDDVFLGQNVVVLGGVTIGDGATVAAGAVVIRDVAPGALVGGVPARDIGGAP